MQAPAAEYHFKQEFSSKWMLSCLEQHVVNTQQSHSDEMLAVIQRDCLHACHQGSSMLGALQAYLRMLLQVAPE
jgi:hypothetical protein